MKTLYKTHGTCSSFIEVEEENGLVKEVRFVGGCSGNTRGISRLVKGMPLDTVIEKLNGTTCGTKSTSCPDQLCRAIEQLKQQMNAQ